MTDALIETLSCRVQHLERMNRLWWCAFVMIGAGLLLIACLGAQPPRAPKKFEAEEIIVVDKDGHTRIRLSVSELGPLVTFHPKDGPSRLFIGLGGGVGGDDGAPYLNFRGSNSLPRLTIGVMPDDQGDSPYLSFSDKKGQSRAAMGLADGDQPYFNFVDEHSRGRLSLGLSAKDGPSIKFMNDRGSTVMRVPSEGGGADKQGKGDALKGGDKGHP